MNKYTLRAFAAKDYSLEHGWKFDHNTFLEWERESEEHLRDSFNEFKLECDKIEASNTYAIEGVEILVHINFGEPDYYEDNLLLVVEIDPSEIPNYVLTQHFGQYMIPQEKYRLDYNYGDLTLNELLTTEEHSSHHYSPVRCFNYEDETIQYLTKESDIVNAQFFENNTSINFNK